MLIILIKAEKREENPPHQKSPQNGLTRWKVQADACILSEGSISTNLPNAPPWSLIG